MNTNYFSRRIYKFMLICGNCSLIFVCYLERSYVFDDLKTYEILFIIQCLS